jgi:hypothetical protein
VPVVLVPRVAGGQIHDGILVVVGGHHIPAGDVQARGVGCAAGGLLQGHGGGWAVPRVAHVWNCTCLRCKALATLLQCKP